MASDIKTPHLCCLFDALEFDTTPPSAEPADVMLVHRAINLNRGWLHRVMGISPPAGSLSAALLACDWDWTEVSLSSFHVIALHPATGCFQRTVFARYHILRFQWSLTATVVVFAHPIRACRPGFTPGYGWKRMFSIGWIFCFQSAESFPLTP